MSGPFGYQHDYRNSPAFQDEVVSLQSAAAAAAAAAAPAAAPAAAAPPAAV